MMDVALYSPTVFKPDKTRFSGRANHESSSRVPSLIGDSAGSRALGGSPHVTLNVVTPAQAAKTFPRALPIAALDTSVTASPGAPDASSAPAAIASIRRAVADVLAGNAAAVVTNPVAKNVLYRSGFAEPEQQSLADFAPHANGAATVAPPAQADLDAPLGPGCYGLRIGDQLVLLRGRNVAVVCRHCCRRHGAAVVGTTRASDKPCSTIWGVVEYRTLACDSRGAAAAEEAKMRTRRSEYLIAT